MPGHQPTTPPTLPQGIEIFKAGRRIDDQGREWVFTGAQVADIAAAYNPALREAPLTVGHPESNRPAYGFVAGLQVQGDTLLMQHRDVEPQFADLVRTRRFPKRSAAFYSPDHPNNPTPGRWYLRHVAFLGAQPPAVPGLKDIEFSDAGADLVHFSETTPACAAGSTEEDTMSDKTAADVAAEKARADQATADLAAATARADAATAQLAQFAEQQARDRHTAHAGFVDQQLQAGRIKRDQVPAFVAVLDLVAGVQNGNVSFGEGDAKKTVSAVELIKGVMASATPLVNFGEHLPGNTGTGGSPNGQRTDAEIDRDAKAYAAKHNVSYADALGKVVSFTA